MVLAQAVSFSWVSCSSVDQDGQNTSSSASTRWSGLEPIDVAICSTETLPICMFQVI